jgi:DNA-binding CsgD family transcriptional regulator
MHLIESPTGLAALGSDAPGIVVIDHARRIVFKNACAEALLASGAAIGERRHALTSGAPSVEAALQAALRSAAAGPERRGGAPYLLSVPRPRALPLMGLIVALPGAIDDLAALALLWDPQAAPLLPSGALAQMFGLTPAETQIAMATYDGLTPVEVARVRGRSVATVRTLLGRVFMKCGVRRQAELVKLLAGIANACSMAHGIRVGLDMQRSGADANPYRRAAVHHLHNVVARELTQARDMQATMHMIDFAPGQTTLRAGADHAAALSHAWPRGIVCDARRSHHRVRRRPGAHHATRASALRARTCVAPGREPGGVRQRAGPVDQRGTARQCLQG